MPQRMLTTALAADRLGVTVQTIKKYIRGGELVAVALPAKSKHGIRYRIHPDELDRFIHQRQTLPRRVTQTAAPPTDELLSQVPEQRH